MSRGGASGGAAAPALARASVVLKGSGARRGALPQPDTAAGPADSGCLPSIEAGRSLPKGS